MTARFGKGPASVPAAVGSQAWEVTVDRQLGAVPDHAEFYALAGEMVATLHALENLARVLRQQVAGYGKGRVLYDDTHRVDPVQRLQRASAELGNAANGLRGAADAVNQFWSEIGHVGVEVTP